MQSSIIRLANHYQHYDWGTKQEIADILKVPPPGTTAPLAELWVGAHSSLPSYSPEYNMYLNDLLKAHPQLLSKHKRSEQLPFLLKLISAQKPLSLQVHPSKEQAQVGFERENADAKPVDASDRNYRDSNHKPEMLYALTPFSAMVGFREADEIAQLFEATQEPNLISWAKKINETGSEQTIQDVFTWLLSLPGDEVSRILTDVIKYSPTYSNTAFYWLNELHKYYGNDIGILFPLLLNVIQLQPGEAIYLGAGCVHAYLKGSGIEIMANSDNVLRGGLTSKHVDRTELASVVRFDRDTNQVTQVKATTSGSERIFAVPCDDFTLSIIELSDNKHFGREEITSAELYLVLRGSCQSNEAEFKSGDAFLVAAGTKNFLLSGCGSVIRVKSALLE